MDQERRDKIDEIFQAAMEIVPGERKAFVERACAGDEGLRAAANELVDAHEHAEAEGFIEGLTFHVDDHLTGSHAGLSAEQFVGPYKIVRPLGSGGMGEVYLAHDTRLDRSVALKILSGQLTTDEVRVHRFRREALAASSLNHPNIITVYEIGEHEGRDFIATEFVEGVTLRARMREKRLSLTDALDIVIQVAGAVGVAHAAGIVHRDIKPENIMVRPDGLVKVLDFGIAKYSPPTRASNSNQGWVKTATGVVFGTTAYMSPEQTRGKEVDARTDIWSMGVVLYEMLARRLPFPGQTPMDRIAAILERDPEPLSKRRSDVPVELEKIVQRALAKDKDKRSARAADLAEDLRKLRVTLREEHALRLPLAAPARALLFSQKRVAVVLATLLLVCTVAVAGLYYLRSGAGVAAIDSIAVLPLVNVGGSADAEYLSDGITESLINSLSQLQNLKVMSRSSVFRYKGQEVDAKAVGNTLSVQAVLTGRVMQRGEDLSVSVELVDARDGSHLWGAQYSRKMTGLVALQSEITRDVSRKVRARLSGPDEQRLARNYTENSEAYELYLRGRYHALKQTGSEIQTGVSYFRRAIELDPSYAPAYAGLADAYRVLALAGETPSAELLPQAKATAQNAIEIDDQLAEAHAVLGFIIFWHDWDWAAAEGQFKRALELDPNSADAHQAYGELLSYTGRHPEALAEMRRARELDPLNLRTNALEGVMLINAGRPDEALARLRQTVELDPTYWFARQYAASAYIEKAMFAEAVAEARKAKELSGVSTRPIAFLGYALARSGKRGEARAELKRLLKLSAERYVSPYNIAMIYNGLGEREETLAWLERGFRQREPRMVFLKAEPKWNNLRDDPRFRDLVLRVGLPQ